MCLFINTDKHPHDFPLPTKIRVPRTVYKLGIYITDAVIESPYQCFKYISAVPYTLDEELSPILISNTYSRDWKITDGFHAFTSKGLLNRKLKAIIKCFSAPATSDAQYPITKRIGETSEWRPAQFTIPSGAHVFIGRDNDIVSDKIIFNRYIPFPSYK